MLKFLDFNSISKRAQNKLECHSLRFPQPSIIFMSKAGVNQSAAPYGAPAYGVGSSCQPLQGTNTLAYFGTMSVTTKKKKFYDIDVRSHNQKIVQIFLTTWR